MSLSSYVTIFVYVWMYIHETERLGRMGNTHVSYPFDFPLYSFKSHAFIETDSFGPYTSGVTRIQKPVAKDRVSYGHT